MIQVYFGEDTILNQTIKTRLNIYRIAYQEHSHKEIEKAILLEWFMKTPDLFDLLQPRFMRYKLDNKITMSQFIQKILADSSQTLKLPIVVTERGVYPGMTPDEVSVLMPKEARKTGRIQLYHKLEEFTTGKLFWKNFESLRKQSELRWFELNDLLFSDVSDDLGEIKKAKDRFFSYKKNKQVPPDDIIEKIQKIFLVDYDDFFRKSVLDLQNI